MSNSSSASNVRKGRGSQVFTQEMACALVEMYYARKKDFPGSGYSLPPEGFEAIATELRAKFNKKLSNIRTRVRNRCRDMRPDADLSALNLTPSEKIYFRHFGPPTGSENRAESGASTPLPNGVSEAAGGAGAQNATSEQNGHSPPGNKVAAKADGPVAAQSPQSAAHGQPAGIPVLNDAATIALVRLYAENLPLFTGTSGQKNADAQQAAVYDSISKHLMHAFHVSLDAAQIRSKIDDVIRTLSQKVDDFRRVSGLENENHIVLRPPNLNVAEAELFDAQFTESPEQRKAAYLNNAALIAAAAAAAGNSAPTSGVDPAALLLQQAAAGGPASIATPPTTAGDAAATSSGDASQQNVVMLGNDLYYVPSSNGVGEDGADGPILTTAAMSAGGNPLGATGGSIPTNTLTVNAAGGPTTSSATTPAVPTSSLASPASGATRRRKNNKRKASPARITDEEMDRRLHETLEAVTSAPKKAKISLEEKRAAIMALEKQRTLRAQRQLAEEELALVRNQMKLAEEQVQFYKVWTEIGNRIRGFLRP
ncbi:hypothetical protein M3Y99_01783900 [Aphelenchoides fujianensis]|nr:hypothetical protein M3Y99_01783900 [Aphelenchoides fujianensis]